MREKGIKEKLTQRAVVEQDEKLPPRRDDVPDARIEYAQVGDEFAGSNTMNFFISSLVKLVAVT